VNFSHNPKFEILGCDKTTPLTEILPQDSKEKRRKESMKRLRQNRIDARCTRLHGWGVLSFLYSHLIHPSLSIILLSLGQGRDPIAVWQCSHSLSWGGWSTSIGTLEGKVTWLSIIETSLAYFHGCCTSTSWGPLHILILNVWGLKEVATWNHLSLWGDKSLPSRLRHSLNTLLLWQNHLGEGFIARIILSDSRWSENTINTHKYNIIY
jgi:hypothetical protein